MSILVLLCLMAFIFMLFVNFDKYVIIAAAWILPLQMLVVKQFSVMSCISLAVFLLAVLKGKLKICKYPFILSSLLLGTSILLSNIFGVFKHWGNCITMISLEVLFPIVVWQSIKSKHELRLFLKHSFIFLIALVLYGLFEEIIRDNPIIRFMQSSDAFSGSIGYTDEIRFGFKRMQSFLPLCGALGCCCTMNFLLFGFAAQKKVGLNQKQVKYVPYLLAGLLLCTLLTGTRSVIAGFLCMLVYFVNSQTIKSRKIQRFIPILVVVLFLSIGFLDKIIDSFTDTQSVSGSNSDMREMQFNLALYFMGVSPILGNGLAYTFEYVQAFFPDEILGAESVWFPLMIDQGLLGVVSYLIYLLFPLLYALKKKMYVVVFCILAFAVEKSLSSLPGINISYFMIYVIVFVKFNYYFLANKERQYETTTKRITK